MKITIHRGTKEVGGTIIEMRSKTTRILLDAGYPLFYNGELIDDQWRKKPYWELLEMGVLPKVQELYRWDKPGFEAVLISHAHSDHFGLLKYIHPDIPVYLSETADRLVEMNLAFPIPGYTKRDRRTFKMYKPFAIGDFEIMPYLMDHSAFQAAAFEIKCEGRTLIYTGDFRGHGKRREYLERFLSEAYKEADLLLIEGTTLLCNGETERRSLLHRHETERRSLLHRHETERTEEELEKELEKVIKASKGIVLCQPASQNIDRIISIYNAAKACGKTFVIDIYTANVLSELREIGHEGLPVPSLLRPDIRVFGPFMLGRRRFCLSGISEKKIGRMQQEIVMLVRPSMLPALKRLNLKDGTLVYSQWQAYRQKPNQMRLEEYLKSRGFSDRHLHTSGHAFEDDIKKIIKGLSPKGIVPIHTFCPEAFLSFHPNVILRQDGVPFGL